MRVQLKDEAGKPLIAEYPDRRTLLRFMASKIPALKTRAQRLANAPPEEKPMVPEVRGGRIALQGSAVESSRAC